MLIKTMRVVAVDYVRHATVQQNKSATGQNAQSVKLGCMSTAQLSPKSASIVEATAVLSISKYVRNLQRIKESHSDTENNYFV